MTALSLVLLFTLAAAAEARTSLPGQTARAIVAVWTCETQLGRERTRAYSPWRPHSQAFRRWQINLWTNRKHACLAELHERARQWNWQAFLPDKWRRVGVCETGLNWFHANSSYVSAFGISVREYDNDARYMGVRPWYVRGQGVPSPWEQWRAAVGHYTRFGGFSGWGCRGA